jgi:hypothetical protein
MPGSYGAGSACLARKPKPQYCRPGVSTRPQSTTLVCSLLDLKKAELPDIFIKIAPKKVENAQKMRRWLKLRIFHTKNVHLAALKKGSRAKNLLANRTRTRFGSVRFANLRSEPVRCTSLIYFKKK